MLDERLLDLRRGVGRNEGGRVAPASKAELATRISGALAKAGPAAAPGAVTAAATQGSVVSEGDKAHGADAARQKFKVTGTGITVELSKVNTYGLGREWKIHPVEVGEGAKAAIAIRSPTAKVLLRKFK